MASENIALNQFIHKIYLIVVRKVVRKVFRRCVCCLDRATTRVEASQAGHSKALAVTPNEAPTKKVKECKKGKLCGNSCISEKAVCHAQ
jgi:hypothetical protein